MEFNICYCGKKLGEHREICSVLHNKRYICLVVQHKIIAHFAETINMPNKIYLKGRDLMSIFVNDFCVNHIMQ